MIRILFAALCIFTNTCLADRFTVDWANDFVVPHGLDRWLSNGVEFSYENSDGGWSFGNEMYTPDDLRNMGIPTGDRNWDGYTYLEKSLWWPSAQSDKRRIAIRLGAVGNASGSRWLQQFVHRDIGLGTFPTWATTNPSEPAAEIIYSHHNYNTLDTFIGISQLETAYGVRVGNVITQAFLSQSLRRGFDAFYAVAELEGRAVLYNTFLDGRLFQDNVYTVDRVPFVAEFSAGLGTNISCYTIELVYRYLTEEFENQDGRHVFGDLRVSYNW